MSNAAASPLPVHLAPPPGVAWPRTGTMGPGRKEPLSPVTVPLQPPPAAGGPAAQVALLSLSAAQLEHAQLR